MSTDVIADLDALDRADHERYVTEIRQQVAAATERGDHDAARRHAARLARIEAIPKPWERRTA